MEITVKAEDPELSDGNVDRSHHPPSKRAPFEHIMETSCENIQNGQALVEAAAKDNYGRKK